jgi:VWFA-related protein
VRSILILLLLPILAAHHSNPQTPPAAAAPAGQPETQSATPLIELNVNRVLVPVVVRDKLGRTVADLKKENFQVFDDGKPRPISAFTVERRSPAASPSASAAGPDQPPPNQPHPPAPSSSLPDRITVFLFDDLHMDIDAMALSTKAATQALDNALSGSDVAAVVSMSGKVNSGLTRDRAKLQEALKTLRPQDVFRSGGAECVDIGYYQAYLMERQHDSAASNDAVHQVLHCNPGIDPVRELEQAERLAEAAAMRAYDLGEQDSLSTYATIREFVRRLSTMPGQRMLVLVSSGFLPLDQTARTEESRLLNLAAESNITISALDARGLYTTSFNASDNLRGRDPNQVSGYRQSSMKLAENSMGELADGTGGAFFHNRNDLDAGFKAITQPPESIYMLELSLDGVKANGTYHHLLVKIDREGTVVQTRRGYFIPKPEKHKK